MKDSKDYYGLAPGKSVLLRYIEKDTSVFIITTLALNLIHLWLYVLPFCRYGFPIKCTNVVFADDNETIREIHAEYDPEKKTKPKVRFINQH